MINIRDKKNCCGCSACANICPKKAITMVEDEEGFKYPTIDLNKCVNCGLCNKVCPIINEKHNDNEIKLNYVCQNLDESIRSISTSGGMFYVFANYILSHKGVVYATGFDDEMNVVYKSANTKQELVDLIGSKYVQSDLKNTFSEVKKLLQEKTPVLFIGTPCQVAGLLNFIPSNCQKDLFTIDLVCYGVPSPGVYQKWIDTLENKYGSKINNIKFRDKKYGYSGTNIKIIFDNKRVIEDSYDAKSYLKTMFSNIGLRPSCYDCKYRKNISGADVTLGDMINVYKVSKEMDDNQGTTFVQIHTKKGEEIFNSITKNIQCKLICDEKLLGNIGKKSKKIPERRKDFFDDYNKMDYSKLIRKYFPYTKKDFISNFIKPIFIKLPYSRQIIKMIRIKRRKK